PAGTLCSSGRIPVFLPFSGWEYVEKDNAIFRQFSDEIGQDIRAHDLTVEQLWTSRLSFSANYKVYEVIIQDSGQQAGAAKLFRRSYFMAKWQESDDSD